MANKKAQVLLEFPSQKHKARFIGGLLDGWGEGAPIDVKWDYGKTGPDGRCEVPATEAAVLRIKVDKDELE